MSLVARIALLRPLARRRPPRWGPRLAEALVTRSQQMSGLPGSTVRRRAAAQEAVALCRQLVAEQPARHGVDLARALVARVAVPDVQSAADAIDQLREAIRYVDDLDDRPARVVRATARWLLAANLERLGEVRAALPTALRSRSTWEGCAPLAEPERMRLAGTLLVIGDCHEALGRPEEAYAARREAMEHYRELSGYRRSRWASVGLPAATDLARSLAAVGRPREAVALIEEFRTDLEIWCRVQPSRGRSALARALVVEAECRADLGEAEAALTAAGRAVDLHRRLAADLPDAHRGALAAALRVSGGLLLGVGRRDEGTGRLVAAAEAARGTDEVELARALIALAVARAAGGESPAVGPLLAEVVPVCRRRAVDLPETFRPLLVEALGLVVVMTAFDTPHPGGQPGKPPADRIAGLDAVTAGREALAVARMLAGADPRHRRLLGDTLFRLDRAVSLAGDPAEAAELLRECVTLRRELSAEDPAHRLDLARALGNLGNRLHVLDRLDEAVTAHRECLATIRADGSGVPPQEAVTPLRNLARTLARLGRTDEALAVAAEAQALEGTGQPGRRNGPGRDGGP